MKGLTAFAAAASDMAADGMEVEGLDLEPTTVLTLDESTGRVEVRELGGAEAAAERGLYRNEEEALEVAAEMDDMERMFALGAVL